MGSKLDWSRSETGGRCSRGHEYAAGLRRADSAAWPCFAGGSRRVTECRARIYRKDALIPARSARDPRSRQPLRWRRRTSGNRTSLRGEASTSDHEGACIDAVGGAVFEPGSSLVEVPTLLLENRHQVAEVWLLVGRELLTGVASDLLGPLPEVEPFVAEQTVGVRGPPHQLVVVLPHPRLGQAGDQGRHEGEADDGPGQAVCTGGRPREGVSTQQRQRGNEAARDAHPRNPRETQAR